MWYAHMMPKSVCVVCVCGGGGGGSDYNSTVIIQSKQWILKIYNLFIIYITLFIIDITLLLIGIIIYAYISNRHIHSNQVIIEITGYEKGKR